MRTARTYLLPSSGIQNIYIANTIHRSIPEMSLQNREILRSIFFEQAERTNVEVLHWSITPRSYRAVIRASLSSHGKSRSDISPTHQFYKCLQQRYSYWCRVAGVDHKWADRVQTLLLDSDESMARAAICCDAMPLIQAIANTPEQYFFSSYWHAKEDSLTMENMRNILSMPTEDWREVKKRYRKALMAVGRCQTKM